MKRSLALSLLLLVGCTESDPKAILPEDARLVVLESHRPETGAGTRYSILVDRETGRSYLVVEKTEYEGGVAVTELLPPERDDGP